MSSNKRNMVGALKNNPKDAKIFGLCVVAAIAGLIMMMLADGEILSWAGLLVIVCAPGVGIGSCMKVLASSHFGGQKINDDFNPFSSNRYLNEARLAMFCGDNVEAKTSIRKALVQNRHNKAAQYLYSIVDRASFAQWVRDQSSVS